jgi:hypothetical protein
LVTQAAAMAERLMCRSARDNIMKTKSVVVLFCMLSLLINACTPSGIPVVVPPVAQSNAEVSISVVTPGNGELFVVGNPRRIALQGHAPTTSATSTINSRAFLANGVPVGTNPTALGYDDFEASWSPSTPGEYFVQAKVTLADGSIAISEPHRICVMPIYSWVDVYGGDGYLGPCQTSTDNPSIGTNVNLTISVVVAPNTVSYSPLCPSHPSVTFIATVNDPEDWAGFTSVSFEDFSHHFHTHYLNWVTTRAGNQKEYRGTVQLDEDLFTRVPQILSQLISWAVHPFARNGQVIGQARGWITVQPIQCSQPHPGIDPPTLTPIPEPLKTLPSVTPTSTPIEPPTFTLNKNAFCRKGPDMTFSDVTAVTAGETVDILNVSEDGFWYFIYWKKFDAKCWVATGTGDVNGDVTGIKVLVGPPLPVPKPDEPILPKPVLPPACTSYADASSCTTHGCSWDKPTSTCK